MSKKLIIFTDGGARNNPGPAGVGVVIKNEAGENIATVSKYIGHGTNNQAEYTAVIEALKKVKDLGASELNFFLDSELVVKQLNREYKVKDRDLALLFLQIYNLSLDYKKITFTHVRREKNAEADALVNEAIDKALAK